MSVRLVVTLIKELEQRAKTKEVQLLRGSCTSYEQYLSTVEHYQALVQTIALVKELAKDITDD